MSEDYFDVVYINFDKVILVGRRKDQSFVEEELTLKQREDLACLKAMHDREMQDMLRRFAGEDEVIAA